MLPTSFLFKNRLFIERESKNRRIFTNFGLIFRNSKWSNYENNNVNFFFKKNYLKLFLFVLTILFVYFNLFYFKFFNNLIFIFWSSFEFISYLWLFFVWWCLTTLSTLVTKFYFFNSKLSFKKPNNVSFKTYNEFKLTSDNFKSYSNSFIKNVYEEDSTLYSNFSELRNQITENLFDLKIDIYFWNQNYRVFQKLYVNLFFLNVNKINDMSLKNYFNVTFTPFHVLISNDAFSIDSNIESNRKWFSLNSNLEANLMLNRNVITGNFINNSESYLTLLRKNFLNESSLSRLKDAKINRWLYKYSLLHRKSFKTIQKLTFFKKTIYSNMYTSSSFKKNLWNSNLFSKKFFKKNPISIANDYYLGQLNQNPFNTINTSVCSFYNNNINLNKLKSIENSYIWLNKRFFTFNSLNNNLFYNNYSNAVLWEEDKTILFNSTDTTSFLNFMLLKNKFSNLFFFQISKPVESFFDNTPEKKQTWLNSFDLNSNDLLFFSETNVFLLDTLTSSEDFNLYNSVELIIDLKKNDKAFYKNRRFGDKRFFYNFFLLKKTNEIVVSSFQNDFIKLINKNKQ